MGIGVERTRGTIAEQLKGNADKSGGVDVARLKPAHDRLRKTRRSAVDDAVDECDADRAAEIAHQVEQAARVRHRGVREMSERHSRRRQQTEHDRHAANNLGPEHLT